MRAPRTPILYQSESAECGLACIAMIGRFFGINTDVFSLRQRFRVSLRGLTLRKVIAIGNGVGLQAKPFRYSAEQVRKMRLPAMLHWNNEHLVVLAEVTRRSFVIHDPAVGRLRLSAAEFARAYSGVAVEFDVADARACAASEFKPYSVWRALANDSGRDVLKLLAVVLSAGFLAEALAVSVPLVLYRLFIGDAVVSSATILYVGLGLAALVASVTFARDRFVRSVSSRASERVIDRVLEKKLSLPFSFFELRQQGHILDRYRALEDIDELLSGPLPLALVDGLLAVIALAALAWASSGSFLIVLGASVGYLLLRVALTTYAEEIDAKRAQAKADESSLAVETLATILSAKSHGLEGKRLRDWRVASARLRASQIPTSNLDSLFRGLRTALLCTLVPAIAIQGLPHSQTLSLVLLMLVGTMGLTRSLYAIDRYADLSRFRQRIARLEDVLRSDIEAAPGQDAGSSGLSASVSCLNLSYSYSVHDPRVIDGISLSIPSGAFAVVTGRNGAGKSTLLKCLAGFYPASGGVVELCGVTLTSGNTTSIRSRIDYICQDDKLFMGTIQENIVGDGIPDSSRLQQALRVAEIDSVIGELPMGLYTKVGATLCPLSAGQRQRVILARSLYRQPGVLFLDEATCSLDEEAERRILYALAETKATIILVTHRPMFAWPVATHLIELADGKANSRLVANGEFEGLSASPEMSMAC